MDTSFFENLKKQRTEKLLNVYNEISTDLETTKPTLNITRTSILRIISFIILFISISFACLALFYAVKASKNFGTNFVLIDITDPYPTNCNSNLPTIPVLSPYTTDKLKSFQHWVFRAGPGAQYYGIGGTPNANANPQCPGLYNPQRFQIYLHSDGKEGQIIKVTNASVKEVVMDNNTKLPSTYLTTPSSINIFGVDPDPSIFYQLAQNKTIWFIYENNGWYLLKTIDSY